MIDVVIVGAGVAGMRIDARLRKLGYRPLILESRTKVGGRVRTVYDETGRVKYESGPWRIAKTHKRMRDLCREHSVDLVPIASPTPHRTQRPHPAMPGLSRYDVNLLQSERPFDADKHDQTTGYADLTLAESSAHPYETDATEFLVATAGFSALMERMAGAAKLRLNTRVVDIETNDGFYSIRAIVRRKDAFQKVSFCARVVFICVPPHVAKEWPSYAHKTRVHLNRVMHKDLQHIYVKGYFPQAHVVDASNPLVQTICDSYGLGWYQGSYTGGRIARFWHHLRLAYPARFLCLIKGLLWRLHKSRVTAVVPHYWHCAYHMWKPVPQFEIKEAVLNSIRPDPIGMPHIYWAGEAYSSFQGWMEGALETADLAVDFFVHNRVSLPVRQARSDEIVIENRIIGRLTEWAAVHPGGDQAILRHRGEDATQLFKHIGHSDDAYAVVAAFQVAWCRIGDVDPTRLFSAIPQALRQFLIT